MENENRGTNQRIDRRFPTHKKHVVAIARTTVFTFVRSITVEHSTTIANEQRIE